jgi:hypothetical protein
MQETASAVFCFSTSDMGTLMLSARLALNKLAAKVL